MLPESVNADFSKRIALDTTKLPWVPSPQLGVERLLLDRIGGEVARATSLVRYAPGSTFKTHVHDMGEEFLVLEGIFSDEHGDYPKGTYVRNPPGSYHAPFTRSGCVILVKLRQMSANESTRSVIDTSQAFWEGSESQLSVVLFSDLSGERVAIEKLAPQCELGPADIPGGEELFILEGSLSDGIDWHGAGTWIRTPAGCQRILKTQAGTTYWVKRGHLTAKL
jgi:hypothetical protein